MHKTLISWVGLLAILIAAPSSAQSHKFTTQPELVLQADGHGAVGVWRVELRGPRAQLMIAGHDGDRNGRLSGPEGERAGQELIRKALRSVAVKLQQRRLRANIKLAQAERISSGSLVAVGVVEFDLQRSLAQNDLLRVESIGGPLSLAMQTLDGWRIGSTDGQVEHAHLERGQAKVFRLEHP